MNKPKMVAASILTIGLATTLSASSAKAQQYDTLAEEALGPQKMMLQMYPLIMTTMDTEFVMMAGQGNRKEIELGRLALERSSDPATRQYAQRLIDDHTAANDRLKEIANHYNILLPLTGGGEGRGTWKRFSNLSGSDFDNAFMSYMRKDHEKDVELYEVTNTNTHIAELKDYTNTTLPTLRQHLSMASGNAVTMQNGSMGNSNSDTNAPRRRRRRGNGSSSMNGTSGMNSGTDTGGSLNNGAPLPPSTPGSGNSTQNGTPNVNANGNTGLPR